MKKKIIISILIILAVIGGYLKFRPKKISELYEFAPVTRENISQTVSATGKIKSASQVDLKFQTGGLLAWVGVKEGDTVKKWQAIASLDKRELSKNLQKTLLDFSKERADFDEDSEVTYRDKALTNSIARILTKNQYDLDKAVLDVELQDLAVKYATLISPIAGIVTRIDVPIAGVNIIPAGAVFTVADPDRLIFEAEVDEVDVGNLTAGAKAELILDAFPEEPIELTVSRIDFNATINASGATIYQVEFDLPANDKFRLGLNGEVTITTAQRESALTAPYSAVSSQKQVRLVKNGQLQTVTVTTGIASNDKVEILEGVGENDQVVITEKK